MKQNNMQSDTTSTRCLTTFCRVMTHKTQYRHDRKKYLTTLARLFKCDRLNFQTYQQILIILEHLRTALNVR